MILNNKILILASLLFIFFNNSLAQQNNRINFIHQNFEQAEMQGKILKKNVFLFCYNSSDPLSQYIEQNIFTNEKVIKYYINNFVNCDIDYNSQEGQVISNKFNLFNRAPVFIFFDELGNPLHQKCCITTVEEALELPKHIENPDSAYFILKNKNEKYPNDKSNLYNYVIARSNSGIFNPNIHEVDSIALIYFKSIPFHEMFNKKNWNAMNRVIKSINDPTFEFLITNKDKYVENFGIQQVDSLIYNIAIQSYFSSPSKFQKLNDSTLYRKSRDIVSQYNYETTKSSLEFIDDLYQQVGGR